MKYCSKIHFRILKIKCNWIDPSIKIFNLVDKHLGYNGSDLRGRDVKHETADARYVAMYLIKKTNPLISIIEIAKLFKRSRAPIYRTLTLIDWSAKHDKKFKAKINIVAKEVFCLPCIYRKLVSL